MQNSKVVPFTGTKKRTEKSRKDGLNKNKEGSVRKINGLVYVDFMYLGERVRESSELPWNDKNAKEVREQLDKVMVAIKEKRLRFKEVFPKSSKGEHFEQREREVYGLKATPDQVKCGEFFDTWYNLLKNSGRIQGRTLHEYKSVLKLYLIPFFKDVMFGALGATTFDRFISWIRQQRYRHKEISNRTINKVFVAFKTVCKQAAIEYGWGRSFDPFFGFRKLPENDAYEQIFPFTIEEQRKLITHLPDHYKPYFLFAFSTGLRPGEQISLKPEDIDWERGLLHIRRAVTLDEFGKSCMGTTKNKYSRRTLALSPVAKKALEDQKLICDRLKSEYFFCTLKGTRIDSSDLRRCVWVPSLKAAGIRYRQMKQTRHTFASIALSHPTNPLEVGKYMGHRNAEMVINVYGKYNEDARGMEGWRSVSDALQEVISNHE